MDEDDSKEAIDAFVTNLRVINANDSLFEEIAIFARKSWDAFAGREFSADSCQKFTAALLNNLMPGRN